MQISTISSISPPLPAKIRQKKTSCCAKIAAWIKQLVREIFCMLKAAFFFFADLSKKDKKPINKVTHTPILLVHGHLHNSSAWRLHKKELEKKGFTVFTVNLGSPFKGVDECAEKRLSTKVKQIQKWTGRKDLSLVGHSMGGIVSSYYATQVASNDGAQVKRVITLGSPMQGTRLAYLTSFTKQARQMQYKAPFLQKLEKDLQKQTKTRLFTIGSKSDLIVLPNRSATSAHASRKYEFDYMGHVSYLYSKDVSKLIIDELNQETLENV